MVRRCFRRPEHLPRTQIYTGLVWTMFQPCSPPVVPTPEAFLDSFYSTKSEMLFCVPSFVEAWARDPEHIKKLGSLRAIVRLRLRRSAVVVRSC